MRDAAGILVIAGDRPRRIDTRDNGINRAGGIEGRELFFRAGAARGRSRDKHFCRPAKQS